MMSALDRVADGDLAHVLDFAQQMGTKRAPSGARHSELRASALDSLDLLETAARDLLLIRIGASDSFLLNQDQKERLRGVAGRFSPEGLLSFITGIRKARRDLRGNANPALAAESLMIGLRYH
jgi:hypothetical protein